MRTFSFVIIFFLNSYLISFAQQLRLTAVYVGYTLSEQSLTFNLPRSVAPHLQDDDAASYLTLIEDLEAEDYRNFSADQGIQVPVHWSAGVELGGLAPESRPFWHRVRLQAGVFVSNTLEAGFARTRPQDFGAAERPVYVLRQKLQFAGLNTGIYRRFPIFKEYLAFTAGFYAQLGVAVRNRFEQQIGIYSNGYFFAEADEVITPLATLQGNHYTQWHLRVPVGLMGRISRFSLRAEFLFGYYEDRYRSLLKEKEGHGLQIHVGYVF